MAGAPFTGYDVLSSTPGGGDEEAFQGSYGAEREGIRRLLSA
jgi:hypothetical protein